jgi:hypothetical protein
VMPMGDYVDGQPSWPSIDDATVEALFAGGAVAPDLEPVAAVVGALKDAATRPTPPGPELAMRMARGAFGRNGFRFPGVAEAARRVEGWLAPWHPRGAANDAEAPTRLAAKAASVGLAITLIGVGTAGFAGALPVAAQDRFESVVESLTPYEFPKVKVGSCGVDRDGVAGADTVGDGSAAGPDPASDGRGAAHRDPGDGSDVAAPGREVREQARGGGVDGANAAARARGGPPAPAGSGGQDSPGFPTGPGGGTSPGQGTAGAPGQSQPGQGQTSGQESLTEEELSTGQESSSDDGVDSDTGPSNGPRSGEGQDSPPSAGRGGQ